MEENLGTAKSDTEVQLIWSSRRQRMAERRVYFESLWRNGITSFFQGIISESINGSRPLYNTLYEQYDFSIFSRDGLRFGSLKYPLLHALVMRAMASEIPNKPKVSFINVGSNDQTKPLAFKHLFNQVLYESNADETDFETFLGKRIFGTSVNMVMTEEYEVTVKDPERNPETDEIVYKKKTKKIRQCLYKNIDIRHVYLDEHCVKTNLSDCQYAQVDEYFSKDEFREKFAKYGTEKVEKACSSTMQKETGQVYENWYDTKGVDYVRVTHCFDKIHDCYHIIANNVLLNEIDTPIPRIAGRRGKEIPLALAVQYKIPNAPYGYGDSHVTTSFNHIKNLVRIMLLEITQKSAKPLIAVDPLSSFDEQGFEWGQDFIRIDPKSMTVIPVGSDLQLLYKLDEITDNDIIRVTGININDTSNVDSGETARKTVIRRESQNALIELTMNYMADSFFKRLYTLLKDDIKLHYGMMLKNGDKIPVRTQNVRLVRSKKGFQEENVKGFRYFDLKDGDLDLDVELDLEIGNIASSRELDKALVNEGVDAMAKFPNGFSQDGVAQYIQEGFEMPDTVLANKPEKFAGGDPKQIAQQALPPEFLPQNVQEQNQLNQQQNAQALAVPPGVPNIPQAGQAPTGNPQ